MAPKPRTEKAGAKRGRPKGKRSLSRVVAEAVPPEEEDADDEDADTKEIAEESSGRRRGGKRMKQTTLVPVSASASASASAAEASQTIEEVTNALPQASASGSGVAPPSAYYASATTPGVERDIYAGVKNVDKTPAEKKITIRVKTMGDHSFPLLVDPNDKLSEVCKLVALRENIPASFQRLIFAGHQLDPNVPIRDYNIGEGSVLLLAQRARGGGK